MGRVNVEFSLVKMTKPNRLSIVSLVSRARWLNNQKLFVKFPHLGSLGLDNWSHYEKIQKSERVGKSPRKPRFLSILRKNMQRSDWSCMSQPDRSSLTSFIAVTPLIHILDPKIKKNKKCSNWHSPPPWLYWFRSWISIWAAKFLAWNFSHLLQHWSISALFRRFQTYFRSKSSF